MTINTTVIGPVVRKVTAPPTRPPKPRAKTKGRSPFELAIQGYSPVVWYRFRSNQYNNRVKDSASGKHLTKQIAAAAQSSVPTRTTHPGGGYFPSVSSANWATQGTYYKGAAGVLSGATQYTLIVSMRQITAPGSSPHKLFGIGTSGAASSGNNDLLLFHDGSAQQFKHWSTHLGGTLQTRDVPDEMKPMSDGVNRLFTVRFTGGTTFRVAASRPGYKYLQGPNGGFAGNLDSISRDLILNTVSNLTANPSPGVIFDQIAILPTDIGASNESALHDLWYSELGGYHPAKMDFDGSTGRYTLTADVNVSAGWTVAGVIKWEGGTITSAGGFNRCIIQVLGSSNHKLQVAVVNDETGDDRAGCLACLSQDAGGTNLMNVFSNTVVSDGEEHAFFASYDPVAGTAQLYVDGVSDINTGASGHTITTGTITTGSGAINVGARNNPDRYFDGLIGQLGVRGAYLTNFSDFTTDATSPAAIDEKNWTEWGAQPLFWNHVGKMDTNWGSAGNMTKNGTITMTEGGSP